MLDARGGLTQAQLDEVARANRPFRVTVLSPAGARERTSGIGGPPPGAGRGFGPGPGSMGAIAERLLSGAQAETVSEVHGGR